MTNKKQLPLTQRKLHNYPIGHKTENGQSNVITLDEWLHIGKENSPKENWKTFIELFSWNIEEESGTCWLKIKQNTWCFCKIYFYKHVSETLTPTQTETHTLNVSQKRKRDENPLILRFTLEEKKYAYLEITEENTDDEGTTKFKSEVQKKRILLMRLNPDFELSEIIYVDKGWDMRGNDILKLTETKLSRVTVLNDSSKIDTGHSKTRLLLWNSLIGHTFYEKHNFSLREGKIEIPCSPPLVVNQSKSKSKSKREQEKEKLRNSSINDLLEEYHRKNLSKTPKLKRKYTTLKRKIYAIAKKHINVTKVEEVTIIDLLKALKDSSRNTLPEHNQELFDDIQWIFDNFCIAYEKDYTKDEVHKEYNAAFYYVMTSMIFERNNF